MRTLRGESLHHKQVLRSHGVLAIRGDVEEEEKHAKWEEPAEAGKVSMCVERRSLSFSTFPSPSTGSGTDLNCDVLNTE